MDHSAPDRALVMMAPATSGDLLVTPADALSRVTRLALGATGLALEALQALLERCVPADPSAIGPAWLPKPPRVLLLLPGVAIGLGLEAQRRSLRTAMALRARLRPVYADAVPPAAHGPLAALWRRLELDVWAARGLAEQRRNQLAAAAFLRELVGGLAAAVLEQVDVDAVVARVNIDRIVERLDLDTIAARVDIDAILRRVDLAGITQQVIDELDVGRIIRESSSTMTNETVDAMRVQGMRADRVLGHVMDRVLRRAGDRQTSLGLSPADPPTGGVGA